MTAFTVTTAKNLDELTAKAGGDTYAINGGTLTVDGDTRYDLNQTTETSLGSITVSSSLGGVVNIDARYVRLIPFNAGYGNVPTPGTVIKQAGVGGLLIGVWSAINVAPTASGSPMPASGYIKVKQVSGAYASGVLTGIGATATGADIAGWIELVGDESATCTVPRLGSFTVRGAWFALGYTSGSNVTTYQLPTSGSTTVYFPGVFVSKTSTPVTDADYEFYPCVGSLAGANVLGTDEYRGKVCWINTSGRVQFGKDASANAIGYVPPAGRKVVVGNVFFFNCTTAARTVNALPNATLGTRYDFTTTGGGAISIDKAAMAWYLSLSNASSVQVSASGLCSQVYLSKLGSALSFSRSGVGVVTTQGSTPLVITGCSYGGSLLDCAWTRYDYGIAWQSDYSANLTVANDRVLQLSGDGYYTYYLNSTGQSTFTNIAVGPGRVHINGCADLTFNLPRIFGRLGASGGASSGTLFGLNSNNYRILIDGMTVIDSLSTDNRIISVDSTSNEYIELRNVGSAASPTPFGAGQILYLSSGVYANRIKIRRVYLSGTMSYISGTLGDATSVDVEMTNVHVAYSAYSAWQAAPQKTRMRGVKALPPASPGNLLAYGSYWDDFFVSTTTSKLYLELNEPSADLTPYVTLTGGAAYTGSGGLYLPTVGMSATFEHDYFVIGHTGFANSALVMTGGTATHYTYRYQIDKNNGAGWSAWSASKTASTLGTALNGENATIDATLGFKLRLEMTTGTTNTAPVTSITISTTSTTETQAYQYPLESYNLTLTGLVAGTEIHAYLGTDPATATEIIGTESSGTSFAFSHTVGGSEGYVTFIKRGLKPFKMPITYSSADVSIPVFLDSDLGYNNPA